MNFDLNVTLRDFQVDTIIEAYDDLHEHGTSLLVSPTGSGKTVMGATLAAKLIKDDARVLFLAPRRELIHQTCDKFEEILGWKHGPDYGVIMAGVEGARDYLSCPLQIASKDTLLARTRRGALPFPRADYVLVDEAHLSLAESFQKILGHYREQGSKVLGLTATPCRQGGKGLGTFYKGMTLAPSVLELIDLGYLVPGTYYAPTTPDLSEARFDYKRGDYVVEDLDTIMGGKQIVGDVVQHWLQHAAGRTSIVFACSIKHSIALTERFIEAGVRAEHIDGNFTNEDRDAVFRRVRAGETQVLVNCAIATYGLDLPVVDCIVLARPTKSLALHLQMLGRGLRPAPGKSDCLVLDHAGNVNRLGFAEDPQPWDLNPDESIDTRKEREREKAKKEKKDAAQINCGQCHHIFTGTHKCPKCGWEVPRRGEDVEHADGDLVRVSPENGLRDLQQEYRMLLGYAKQNGYAEGWAFHTLKNRRNFPAPRSWINLGPLEPNADIVGYAKYLRIRRAKSNVYRDRAARVGSAKRRA